MELILWRHAEAERASAGLPDQERKLTPIGLKQAQKMADWIRPRLPKQTKILVGPSVRTCQTADFLEMPYTVERKVGIGADIADIIAAAQWPGEGGSVMVVCHQPSIGHLASLFIAGIESEMPIKKCGMLWFSTREREHRMQVVLRAVIYPDLV